MLKNHKESAIDDPENKDNSLNSYLIQYVQLQKQKRNRLHDKRKPNILSSNKNLQENQKLDSN